MNSLIIGIDEVNFSPSLAGDCVVVALARRQGTRKVRGVRDSKQLTHRQRLSLFGKLQDASLYAVVPATVNDINLIGIYKARNLAIFDSIGRLLSKLQYAGLFPADPINVLIDGYFSEAWQRTFRIKTNLQIECLIKGDEKIYEISAASIIGRVYADALFAGFGSFYPGYRLELNHGSPDKIAYEKIRESGPTPYHRTNYGKGWWEKIMRTDKTRR